MMTSGPIVEHIKQFKVIQRTKTDISIQIVRNDSYSDEHTSLLRRQLAENLGDDTNVDFEFVDRILPEKSGKYRLVVSELRD
jgi:phenylacetate-CoA ligase